MNTNIKVYFVLGYAAYVSFAICNWILLARTKALLGNKRAVSYILIIFYFLSYGVNGVLVTLSSAPLVGESESTLYSS